MPSFYYVYRYLCSVIVAQFLYNVFYFPFVIYKFIM